MLRMFNPACMPTRVDAAGGVARCVHWQTAFISKPLSYGRPSGVAYEYSNLGFALLGRVISTASGQAFRDFISQRILVPLGMHDTCWSDLDCADRDRLALGYARIDGDWIAQPIQQPGAFSSIGGLYSSVGDLAIWLAGFMDAWDQTRGEDLGSSHPLSMASRREMQQVHTTQPLSLGAPGVGLQRVESGGYCYGWLTAPFSHNYLRSYSPLHTHI
eukprot:COSAG01_NODE_5201_length_4414_cov_468.710313_5_plen_216_part_00